MTLSRRDLSQTDLPLPPLNSPGNRGRLVCVCFPHLADRGQGRGQSAKWQISKSQMKAGERLRKSFNFRGLWRLNFGLIFD